MTQILIAKSYIGQLEKPKNSGFQDPKFEADMRALGEWVPSYAWCACFAQMVFRKAYPERSEELRRLFDPSTRKTFDNFRTADFEISQKPVLGSLVIWATYKAGVAQWTGHAGIVSEVISDTEFKSIDGNTSKLGSRNGDRVGENKWTTAIKPNGLNVLGFITI